jgi:hypothetical protein
MIQDIIKRNKTINENTAYEVVMNKYIEEVNSDAWLLKHKKTGAKIVLLSNEDDNKVFNIGFRTPVEDNTGVPHIIEHTVLCGSKNFPVKDPFMELVKGSLNTFLNAMTYPDKTVYPVASYNDKDFKNLMHIYMDAVFNPNIYKEDKIFKQEGWHYELADKDAPLEINGIVYNEMKGVYSSIDGIAARVTSQSLFPDNGYKNESGGEPDFIPELSYEEYLQFHRKYYHPSNSFIYLYGDMDMSERLDWMDKEYLSEYDSLKINSEIVKQAPFEKRREMRTEYAISEHEKEEESAMLTSNYVIGDNLDAKLMISFRILKYALMEIEGAPLKQALIDAGIGKAVYGSFDDDIYQPVYSIVAKNTSEKNRDKFINIIEQTLNEILEKGIDKNTLAAGLNSIEFDTKESDFGTIPKGLMWGLDVMASWLYDERKPFVHLETNKIFDELREKISTDYFEKLIKQYLIENTHHSVVVLAPKRGLTEEKERILKEKLEEKKAQMTEEELDKIIEDTKELEEFQGTPSTPEQLKAIPLLKIEDINPQPKPLISQKSEVENVTILHNDIFTNGIGYADIVFDCSNIPERYHQYIGLLKHLLTYMDTGRGYMDLNMDIDLNLGGLSFDTGLYVNDISNKIVFNMEIHVKTLYEKIEKAYEIIQEVILKTRFDDTKRLRELLEELKLRIYRRIVSGGDSSAKLRAMSYYSKPYYIREQIAGIAFYEFVKDIVEHYDEKKEYVVSMLKQTVQKVFTKENITLNYTGDGESFKKVKEYTISLKANMFDKKDKYKENFDGWDFVPNQRNEAFITSGQVQYVAMAGNYNEAHNEYPYTGSFFVLGNIMRNKYLWNNVREVGGAYGCNCMIGRTGDGFFSSYRDPKLAETINVFKEAPNYIEKFDVDEREMRKYIIGTVSLMDTPMNAADIGTRELANYMAGVTYDSMKKTRQEVLSTAAEDIRKLAPMIRRITDRNNICVVGSKSSIENAKDLFKEIKELG